MKYTLPRDLPPPTVDRDFAHRAPDRTPPTYGRVIGGIAVMSGLVTWLLVFLRITP